MAFAGVEETRRLYELAVEERYRFYSFGDAMLDPVSFTVTATDGAARAGVLRTAHGDVPTPAFMPVGTKATVKTLDPDELRALGATIVLGNTYHLHFRPGEELIAELGGLHRFMGWDGPILTDSGGFQVFSLRDTIARCRRRGRDLPLGLRRRGGALHARVGRRDPGERSARTSRCASTSARRPDVHASGARARRAPDDRVGDAASATRRARPASSVFGIAQGGVDPELRRRSIEEIVGARLRRPRARRARGRRGPRRDVRDDRRLGGRRCSPRDRPRYFMGIGDPEGILEVIERGVDMFDCVLPTRIARTGIGADVGGPPEPPQRPLRPRSAAARRGLRRAPRAPASRARTSGTS